MPHGDPIRLDGEDQATVRKVRWAHALGSIVLAAVLAPAALGALGFVMGAVHARTLGQTALLWLLTVVAVGGYSQAVALAAAALCRPELRIRVDGLEFDRPFRRRRWRWADIAELRVSANQHWNWVALRTQDRRGLQWVNLGPLWALSTDHLLRILQAVRQEALQPTGRSVAEIVRATPRYLPGQSPRELWAGYVMIGLNILLLLGFMLAMAFLAHAG